MHNLTTRSASFLLVFILSQTGLARNDLPLFDRYPSLKESVHWVDILEEETPVEPLSKLQRHLGQPSARAGAAEATDFLWVKRDDRSWSETGGNKGRKMEFLIGEAKRRKAKVLVTSGMWGSNHALATASMAKRFGLESQLILGPQPVSKNVRKKLLSFHALGAVMRFHGNMVSMGLDIVQHHLKAFFNPKKGIYNIPPGGSSDLGSLGYVNAYFELKEQLKGKEYPSEIVLPIGTGGTAVGLLVGSCISGDWEKIRISGVAVSSPLLMSEGKVRRMAKKLHKFIKKRLSPEDRAELPSCNYTKSKKALSYVKHYFAPKYGAARQEVLRTIALLQEHESLTLEQTYTGKAMQYFVDQYLKDLLAGGTPQKRLFWLTYNSYDLRHIIDRHPWKTPSERWKELPKKFHPLFQEDLI